MTPPRGTVLLVLLLLSYYAVIYGRAALHDGGSPAFFVEDRQTVAVLLGEGFPRSGIRKFSDGIALSGVIEMTGLSLASELVGTPLVERPLHSGEALSISCVGSQVVEIERYWMPATQRMALAIPLHPERMSCEDWQALPGIGAKLAQRIEDDRQQNGEFTSLEGLARVRGIGPRRIKAWQKFFR